MKKVFAAVFVMAAIVAVVLLSGCEEMVPSEPPPKPPPEEPPVAVLTGVPTGTNDTTVLSVTVSGDRVVRYRHKVTAGTVCTAEGYGPSTAVGTRITDDISALDDGPVTLCVIGIAASGLRQTGATKATWTKQMPPTAVLTGAPTGTNDTAVLSVTVSGDRVARYRHKVAAGTVCTTEGYGPSTPVGTRITDDISALDDGPVTLCVIGIAASGLRQTGATKATWTKQMPPPPEEPPIAVLTGAPTGTNDTTALSVTVSGDRVVRYRHKVTEGTVCTDAGYGPSTAVGTRITDDISALADGPVTLCVIGIAGSGLRQTGATKATWTKQMPPPPEEPPIAVLTGAPTGTNDTTALSVTVSGDRVVRYRHKVTEGTVCTDAGYGPSTAVGTRITDDISALADGPVTLCVIGIAGSGLRQTGATKATWTKQMPPPPEEPPTAVLTGAPTGTNDTTVLSVTVSGDRVVRYRHKVTEGTVCTAEGYGPSTAVGTRITDDISALDDGPVTLCVIGIAASGLRQTGATKATWTKQMPPPEEPPTAVLTGAPTGTNDTTVLSVTVSGDRVVRYRHKVTEGTVCTAEGYGPSTAVGTRITDDISALDDGPVTLCVIGIAASGLRQTGATKATWTKQMPPPEEPPTAVLTGAPTGTNDTTVLSVTVSGDRVVRYRHKVTAGTVCTAEGYGPSTAVGTRITDDISALDDGPVTLCVIGIAASGLRQTGATKATWTKQMPPPPEEPPTAVLTGAPTGTNDTTVLSVTVSGDRVVRYRHKVTAGTVCTAEGYGPSTAVGTRITDDISALDDGPVTLCVIGIAASGLRQTGATKATWTKQMPPQERYCENGAAAETDPSQCKRGQMAIPGIDRIPLDMVKLTNREMQSRFALTDDAMWHAIDVGGTACESFITNSEWCSVFSRRASIVKREDNTRSVTSGLSSFTQVVDLNRTYFQWGMEELIGLGAQIVAYPFSGATIVDQNDKLPYVPMPYLTIQSAGNRGVNSWFTMEIHMGDERRSLANQAFAANKYIFVAGFDRDGSGNYIRHNDSNGCVGIIDGCVWVPYTFPVYGVGTSLSAPNFAAALASILAVFPDSTHQNLLKLAKACARKTGNGIEKLLRDSGGIGVADFSCMKKITDTARNLPTGGSASVIIDGKTVTVTERKLIVQ